MEKKILVTAEIFNGQGLLYYVEGKYEQAEPLYKRALSLRENTHAVTPDLPPI